jgi:hypothetical protein
MSSFMAQPLGKAQLPFNNTSVIPLYYSITCYDLSLHHVVHAKYFTIKNLLFSLLHNYCQ